MTDHLDLPDIRIMLPEPKNAGLAFGYVRVPDGRRVLRHELMGFDPAYASSPLVATFVEMAGVVIYFSIASVLLL